MNVFSNLDPILKEDYEWLSEQICSTHLTGVSILVTGATGLVGSNLIKALLYVNKKNNLNLTVIAWCRNKEKSEKIFKELLSFDELKLVYSDIEKKPNELQVFSRIDYIIHAASVTSSKTMVEHPVGVIYTSLRGTENLLEIAHQKKCQSFVYVSSMEVYGSFQNSKSVNETEYGFIDPLAVRSNYPESKRMCENMCIAYLKEFGVPIKIARLAQTFGAGILDHENRVFAQFARSAIQGQDIVLHTAGASEGNYCYLRDALFGLIVILLKGEAGEAYNVANEDCHITIKNMAEMVCHEIAKDSISVIYDIPDENVFGYAKETKMKLSSSKLQKLGWKPQIGLKEAYERMIGSMISE